MIAPVYPFFDGSVPQRTRDIDAAKALLEEAGVTGLTATLHFGELQEIPELAQLVKQQAAEAGITLDLAGESLDTFYGAQWCPAEPADPPCSGAAELGIVDYGHRATPDVYLNAALSTGGIWNSSQYSSPDFDAAFVTYQEAIGVEEQTAACKTIEEILNDEVPVILPYFYNYISGFSKSFTGVRVSALGQLFLDRPPPFDVIDEEVGRRAHGAPPALRHGGTHQAPPGDGTTTCVGGAAPMTRYVLRRLALSLVTLWLIVTFVFVIVNVLPNDIGRQLSGPFAPQEQVDALNERAGYERPAARAVRPAGEEHAHVRLRGLVRAEQAGVGGDR